jgi:hypothetical protein
MMNTTQVEKRFKQLKSQFETGTLTENEFKKQLEKLMIQDEQGSWWMIGYKTGLWYRHDGTEWVLTTPLSKYSQKSTFTPKWISILWIILGWSIGWAIGILSLGAMSTDSELAIGGAITGAIGGLVTGIVLRIENSLSNWRNILWVTLAWIISSAIGWYYDYAITLTVGGLVTALILRSEKMLSDVESTLLITLAWAIGSTIGGKINEAVVKEGINDVLGAFIYGVIGATIGGFVMIWQLKEGKKK